ncbi:ABC transporter permease [Eudoraea chungangensis]|uniref:ABC transporter permease n=1 Tax=Eudoraea chungangensis TaxID=1481905 RepID=UPI0023ED27D5|nr:ABC transporter permease [Eudoraea chungangensis]
MAFRSLQKRKGFTLINVLGLSLGIWCTLLISLWILDEYDKDNFHDKGDRISQVLTRVSSPGDSDNIWDGTGYPVAEALSTEIPEIESVVRITANREANLKLGDKIFKLKVRGADKGFFNIFSFPLKEGNKDFCLDNLKSIVLSEKLATRYFPQGNALGKVVSLNLNRHAEAYRVSGIFNEIPEQSTVQFDAVIPLDNFLPMNNKSWGNTWVKTFILQKENTETILLNQKIRDIPQRIGDDQWRTLVLQPFKDRYLYSKFENGKVVGGRIDYVILFGIIAVFTLLIACFNFINLTTAAAIKRSKEVGIKKVIGAGKRPLLGQFFVESTMLVCISVILAMALTINSIPFFNALTEKTLTLNFSNLNLYLVFGAITIGTILCSGIYPALSLASFKSTEALMQKLQVNTNELRLRKGLVVLQFFLCMVMITATMVVYLQLEYIQDKNLGIAKENIFYMEMDLESYAHSQSIKNELLSFSGIKEVSTAGGNFIEMNGTTSDPVWEGMTPDTGQKWFSILDVDFGLLEMLNISIKEGRNFSEDYSRDTLNFIINEEAVRVMKIKDPLGKSLSFWGEEGGRIIGVVKDFHFTSLHNPITPLIIRCRPKETYLFYLKSTAGKTKEAIAHMGKVHRQFSSLPMNYHFLDSVIEMAYKDEEKVQSLAIFFAVLTIVISCLGLFGLAMFSTQQRIKEIAVRKVLGANIIGLFEMLSKDFIKLVFIALCLAIPLSWYFLNNWIQSFAFHIHMQWWIFVLAGIILIGISLITVSYQTLKVAHTNPVKSLRKE